MGDSAACTARRDPHCSHQSENAMYQMWNMLMLFTGDARTLEIRQAKLARFSRARSVFDPVRFVNGIKQIWKARRSLHRCSFLLHRHARLPRDWENVSRGIFRCDAGQTICRNTRDLHIHVWCRGMVPLSLLPFSTSSTWRSIVQRNTRDFSQVPKTFLVHSSILRTPGSATLHSATKCFWCLNLSAKGTSATGNCL